MKRIGWAYLGVMILLVVTIVIAVTCGSSSISWQHMTMTDYNTIFNIRLPRLVADLVGGAALAISGAFYQATFRNPIADAGILGISAGADLFAVVAALVIPGAFWFKVGGALIGGTIVLVVLVTLQQFLSPTQLILVGVAMDASITGVQKILNTNQLNGLATVTWTGTMVLAVVGVIVIIAALFVAHWGNYLKVSDEFLESVGLNPRLLRTSLLIIATILATCTTAVIGIVAFLGIIVPQSCRVIIGRNYQNLIPFAGLCGAWLLLATDTFGRLIVQPSEISAQIILAIVGGPFLIVMLVKGKRAVQ